MIKLKCSRNFRFCNPNISKSGNEGKVWTASERFEYFLENNTMVMTNIEVSHCNQKINMNSDIRRKSNSVYLNYSLLCF